MPGRLDVSSGPLGDWLVARGLVVGYPMTVARWLVASGLVLPWVQVPR